MCPCHREYSGSYLSSACERWVLLETLRIESFGRSTVSSETRLTRRAVPPPMGGPPRWRWPQSTAVAPLVRCIRPIMRFAVRITSCRYARGGRVHGSWRLSGSTWNLSYSVNMSHRVVRLFRAAAIFSSGLATLRHLRPWLCRCVSNCFSMSFLKSFNAK
jgi:hypothetical protein